MIGRVITRVLAVAATVLAGVIDAGAEAPLTGRVTSRALGEVREYTVYLPEAYAREPQRRYAVAYVLDGPPLDQHTAAGAAASGAPPLIVVGIPNMQRGGRARDFLPPTLAFARRDGTPFRGGADRFLAFLRDELAPRIERDYRTTRPRLLVGHSLGAIFVTWSLEAAPRDFDARFAHSPAIWRDEDRIASMFDRTLARARHLGGFFYLSVGAGEGDGLGRLYGKLEAALRAQATGAGLPYVAAITPGAVHETNVRLATPASLRAWAAAMRGR